MICMLGWCTCAVWPQRLVVLLLLYWHQHCYRQRARSSTPTIRHPVASASSPGEVNERGPSRLRSRWLEQDAAVGQREQAHLSDLHYLLGSLELFLNVPTSTSRGLRPSM